jgi:hypothetical protein
MVRGLLLTCFPLFKVKTHLSKKIQGINTGKNGDETVQQSLIDMISYQFNVYYDFNSFIKVLKSNLSANFIILVIKIFVIISIIDVLLRTSNHRISTYQEMESSKEN